MARGLAWSFAVALLPFSTAGWDGAHAAKARLSVIYNFPAGCAQTPKGLGLASDGNLYGTTSATQASGPTVFRVTGAGAYTTVATFDYATQGDPSNAPFIGTDGKLHGISFGGGPGGGGTVYRIEANGAITTQIVFGGTNGLYPTGLVQTADGTLYGITAEGGASGAGNGYKLTPDGTFTNIVSCTVHTCYLPTSLMLSADGQVFATAEGYKAGFANSGQIFALAPAYRVAFNFNGTRADTPITLVSAKDGALYGLTDDFMADHQTFFRFKPPGRVKFLGSYHFASDVVGGPVQGADGNFYGTLYGDIHHPGWIFQLTPAGAFSIVATFDGKNGAGIGSITPGSDGAIYGTTWTGGATGGGVIFRMSLPSG